MPITHEFEYHKPRSLSEALKLLGKYGEKGELLAGGTDVVVNMKDDLLTPKAVIDIKGVEELSNIRFEDSRLFIGAKTTFSDIVNSPEIREKSLLLWESAKAVASVGIRNRATLVGNICSAVPCMDSAPALLCYEATVHLMSENDKRDVPISRWFVAPRKTGRKANEIVTGVSFVIPENNHGGCYIKLGRYGGEDLAQAGLAVLMTSKDEGKSFSYRLAYTAVGPVPVRVSKTEDLLEGKELTDELINNAKNLVSEEIKPITDIRATREYREHICKVMLERGLIACRERFEGKEIETIRILGG